jgi:hypothetical protein
MIYDHRYNVIYKEKVKKLFLFAIRFSDSRIFIFNSRSANKDAKIGQVQGLNLTINCSYAMHLH